MEMFVQFQFSSVKLNGSVLYLEDYIMLRVRYMVKILTIQIEEIEEAE